MMAAAFGSLAAAARAEAPGFAEQPSRESLFQLLRVTRIWHYLWALQLTFQAQGDDHGRRGKPPVVRAWLSALMIEVC
jgi:hypothetical protein